MTDQAPQKFKVADDFAEKSVKETPETARHDGVIAGQANQEIHGQAFEKAHQNDKTLSESDMIAIREGETVAEFSARVEAIQANRFGFFDSEVIGSAEETGTVTDYQPVRTGKQSYSLRMDYEEGRNTRSTDEKLADFGRAAAARAADPEGQKAFIQGQLDKIIGICEGLSIAKDSTKSAVSAGLAALTDGTVAEFLSKPNAINEPLFHVVGGALDAMAQDPNSINHALDRVGSIVMSASELYTYTQNREKGHVIGETMFALVNPEGSTEAGSAALIVADAAVTGVDAAVMKTVQQAMKAIEEAAKTSPEFAQQTRQMLYEYVWSRGMSGPELEYAGVPRGYFDGIQAPKGAAKGDNFLAMSKAHDLEGEAQMRGKAGAGGDWPVINERSSLDVVRQTQKYSCVSACGEMLTNGKFKQAELIDKLGAPCDTASLADALGPPWRGENVTEASLDALLCRESSWAAELREIHPPYQYRRLEPAHTVVVDGLSEQGNIIIRDPVDGTKYEMTRENFLLHWNLMAVYR